MYSGPLKSFVRLQKGGMADMSLSRKVVRGAALAHAPLVLVTRAADVAAAAESAGDETPVSPEEEAVRMREEAAGVLAAARRDAEETARQAREEAEAAVRRAREDGYARGLEEARAAMAEETAAAREQARVVLRSAEETRRETLAALDGEVRELALTIAEQVVGRQLSLDPGVVESIAGEALRLVRDREQVVLFAHPEDAALLRARADDLRAVLGPGASFTIMEDASLTCGGCLIDTGEGLVDARLESRWQALREVLKR